MYNYSNNYNPTIRIQLVTPPSSFPVHFVMYFSVTLPAQRLQVLPVQSNAGVVCVVFGQRNFVVYDFRWCHYAFAHTPFTQTPNTLCVCLSCVFPCLAVIQPPCVTSSHDQTITKDTSNLADVFRPEQQCQLC